MSKWNLRNYEIFAHRGYDGTNTLQSFDNAVLHGYHVECDIVQTADGTVFINHDRSVNDNGTTVNVAEMTDAVFRTYFPNQPTASEFITWMQNNPNTLACISAYQGLETFLPMCKNGGIDDRVIFDATVPTVEQVRSYPKVSWCIANVSSDAELDKYRTPYNIVSGDECEDNSDGEFPVMRQWSNVGVNTIDSLIQKGVTWFVSAVNGSDLDALAEKIKNYKAPNYSNAFMINECAKALRTKSTEITDIYGRNIPSQIRKLPTSIPVEGATELNLKALSNSKRTPQLSGHIANVAVVNIDMGNLNANITNPQYSEWDNPCVINYTNISSTTVIGDFARGSTNIKEINFIGGYYPNGTLARFLYQINDYPLAVDVKTNRIVVTGLYLDNITGLTNMGMSDSGVEIEILWEGTLNASVDVSACKNMTALSVSRLLNCLADYSAGEQHTLTLGTTLLAKATEEDLALATARNWVVA